MDVKISLPLLPLRDIVVFPSMVVPLFVGRDKSISALNEVMKNDKKIILVTQKNSEIDDPKKTDIFTNGCEGNILQLLKLPDGTVKVLVEGIKRVKILDFKDNEKFITCEYTAFNDVIDKNEDLSVIEEVIANGGDVITMTTSPCKDDVQNKEQLRTELSLVSATSVSATIKQKETMVVHAVTENDLSYRISKIEVTVTDLVQ